MESAQSSMTYYVSGVRHEDKHSWDKFDTWTVHLKDSDGLYISMTLRDKPNFNTGDYVLIAIGKIDA